MLHCYKSRLGLLREIGESRRKGGETGETGRKAEKSGEIEKRKDGSSISNTLQSQTLATATHKYNYFNSTFNNVPLKKGQLLAQRLAHPVCPADLHDLFQKKCLGETSVVTN